MSIAMKILILFLLSPTVICSEKYSEIPSSNDEPFLPIYSQYPYNPKLMKRGLDQQQEQRPQPITELSPELYIPKIDPRDSYSEGYSQNNHYPTYNSYSKPVSTANSLTNSYFAFPHTTNAPSSYGFINPYSSPYNFLSASYGTNAQNFRISPYTNMGVYPNYYYPHPYHYSNYYNPGPVTYGPPPAGYLSRPSKHQTDDEEDDENNDNDKGQEKSKKNTKQKNRIRNTDNVYDNNQYADGNNYIINSSKDLHGESSTNRIPSPHNQIEQDSDLQIRTPASKSTYPLINFSGQPASDYNSNPDGYIKIQQLEQLMRRALSKLLAQNAAQQENLSRIQEEVQNQQINKNNQQYIPASTTIAKTGLSYVVNPMILNRVNPSQTSTSNNQYNPSALLPTQASLGENNQSYPHKTVTSVTLQQSPGIYIPPSKINNNDQLLPAEYEDYDSQESVTSKTQGNPDNYKATVETTRKSYLYSTYRPTPQTNLDDVNFGAKQKTGGKS